MEAIPDLRSASKVLVIDGAGYSPQRRADSRTRHVETSRECVDLLIEVVQSLEGEPHQWMEWPVASLVFLDGKTPIAEFGVLASARWIRLAQGGDYVAARSSELRRAWLVASGLGRGFDLSD